MMMILSIYSSDHIGKSKMTEIVPNVEGKKVDDDDPDGERPRWLVS
jgi:hypothetical protein